MGTNLLKRGSDWLQDMQQKHASATVVYCREQDQVEVTAQVGAPRWSVDMAVADVGIFFDIEYRDFLIMAADLVLDGCAASPKVGDRIIETNGDEVIYYEVASPGPEPAWRYTDDFHKRFRIHAKRVDDGLA